MLERTRPKPRRRDDARRRDRVVRNRIFMRDFAAVSEPSALPDAVSCLGNCERAINSIAMEAERSVVDGVVVVPRDKDRMLIFHL